MSECAAESAELSTNPLRDLLVSRPVPGRTIPRVIGFSGLAGAGKSTATLHLISRYGAEQLRFSGGLKAGLVAMCGLSLDEIEGSRKEAPCVALGGQTPRYAMQTLGYEWGRKLIHPDIWVLAWANKLQQIAAQRLVVTEDVRFPNEVEAIHAVGGFVIHIIRPGHKLDVGNHATEAHVTGWDRRIINDGTPAQLEGNASSILTDFNVAWSKARAE